MFTPPTTLTPAPGVSVSDAGLRIDGVDVAFNDTAVAVWRCFDGAARLDDVAASVASEFELDPHDAYVDVSRIAAILVGRGALSGAAVEPTRQVPHVPPGDGDVDSLVWELARWVRGGPEPSVWLTPDLVTRLRRRRMGGVLVALAAEGDRGLDAGTAAALTDLHMELAAISQILEARVLDVAARFAAVGIEYRVLKGIAHARLDYPRWECRPFGDIDLLVRRGDLRRAQQLLLEAGGRPYNVETSVRLDPRYAKALTVVFDGIPRAEVDIHADLVAGPFGVWMDTDRLFEESRPLPVSGQELPALSVSDAFLHACYTAVIGNWTINPMALLDVVQLADAGPEPDRVWSVARSWRGTVVVCAAARLALEHFPSDRAVLEPWMRSPSAPGRVEQLVGRADVLPDRSPVVRELLTTAVQPGVRARLIYFRSVVRPADNRGETLGSRLRRWMPPSRSRR